MKFSNGMQDFVTTREFEARHAELVVRLARLDGNIQDIKNEQGKTWKYLASNLLSLFIGIASTLIASRLH